MVMSLLRQSSKGGKDEASSSSASPSASSSSSSSSGTSGWGSGSSNYGSATTASSLVFGTNLNQSAGNKHHHHLQQQQQQHQISFAPSPISLPLRARIHQGRIQEFVQQPGQGQSHHRILLQPLHHTALSTGASSSQSSPALFTTSAVSAGGITLSGYPLRIGSATPTGSFTSASPSSSSRFVGGGGGVSTTGGVNIATRQPIIIPPQLFTLTSLTRSPTTSTSPMPSTSGFRRQLTSTITTADIRKKIPPTATVTSATTIGIGVRGESSKTARQNSTVLTVPASIPFVPPKPKAPRAGPSASSKSSSSTKTKTKTKVKRKKGLPFVSPKVNIVPGKKKPLIVTYTDDPNVVSEEILVLTSALTRVKRPVKLPNATLQLLTNYQQNKKKVTPILAGHKNVSKPVSAANDACKIQSTSFSSEQKTSSALSNNETGEPKAKRAKVVPTTAKSPATIMVEKAVASLKALAASRNGKTKTVVDHEVRPKIIQKKRIRIQNQMQKRKIASTPFKFPDNPIINHTIELLQHKRDLKRRFELLENDGVVLRIGELPQLAKSASKGVRKEPLTVPNIPLTAAQTKEIIQNRLPILLAHGGYTHVTQQPLELLSDVLEGFYTKMAQRLKQVTEMDMTNCEQEFPDPLERVLQEMNLGGVRGVEKYYKSNVVDYRKRLEARCIYLRKLYAHRINRLKPGAGKGKH